MDEETRKRLEYEEQFFGISSLIFSDCFKKFVKDEVDSKMKVLMNNLERKLQHQAKNPDQFRAAMQEMMSELSREYVKILDRLFPEIDNKISTFVCVPSNVLLKEDLSVRSGTGGVLKEIQDEIEMLKGTFKSLLYLKEKLREELQEVDSVILCLEYFIEEKKFDFEILS